jgi:hypothetical protein
MRVAWGGYLARVYDWATTTCAKNVYHIRWSDCVSFKYPSGRWIWGWCFSLTSGSIKQVQISHHAPSFSFVFPHFLAQQVSRCDSFTVPTFRKNLCSRLHCVTCQKITLLIASAWGALTSHRASHTPNSRLPLCTTTCKARKIMNMKKVKLSHYKPRQTLRVPGG